MALRPRSPGAAVAAVAAIAAATVVTSALLSSLKRAVDLSASAKADLPLLAVDPPLPPPPPATATAARKSATRAHAVVVGGSIAGLA
ncbi:hypothetical protein HK405_009748, partial [Cladochytrium tenue]